MLQRADEGARVEGRRTPAAVARGAALARWRVAVGVRVDSAAVRFDGGVGRARAASLFVRATVAVLSVSFAWRGAPRGAPPVPVHQHDRRVLDGGDWQLRTG